MAFDTIAIKRIIIFIIGIKIAFVVVVDEFLIYVKVGIIMRIIAIEMTFTKVIFVRGYATRGRATLFNTIIIWISRKRCISKKIFIVWRCDNKLVYIRQFICALTYMYITTVTTVNIGTSAITNE